MLGAEVVGLELRVAGQEAPRLLIVLARRDRAGGVDERAALPHLARRGIEQSPLQLLQLRRSARCLSPARVGRLRRVPSAEHGASSSTRSNSPVGRARRGVGAHAPRTQSPCIRSRLRSQLAGALGVALHGHELPAPLMRAAMWVVLAPGAAHRSSTPLAWPRVEHACHEHRGSRLGISAPLRKKRRAVHVERALSTTIPSGRPAAGWDFSPSASSAVAHLAGCHQQLVGAHRALGRQVVAAQQRQRLVGSQAAPTTGARAIRGESAAPPRRAGDSPVSWPSRSAASRVARAASRRWRGARRLRARAWPAPRSARQRHGPGTESMKSSW